MGRSSQGGAPHWRSVSWSSACRRRARTVIRGRRLLRKAALATAVLAAGACTSGSGEPAASNEPATTIPRAAELLRVGAEEWPECLNPLTCRSAPLDQLVLEHVLPKLFVIDENGDYRPSGLLAEEPRLDVADDGSASIRYVFADDARWADGRPLTSSDVHGTWRAIVDTPGASQVGYDQIVAVDVADPAVAVVDLAGPIVDWQELFGGGSGFVLQADRFGGDTDLTGEFVDVLPMSAGPYEVTRFSGEGLVLAAVADEAESDPDIDQPDIDQVQVDRIDLDELDDPTNYDIVVPASSRGLRALDGFDARTTPTTAVVGVFYDQRSPTLEPLVNRQIVDLVLDRSALAAAADGPVVPCAGWLPNVGAFCDAAASDVVDPNPALATFALIDQGWAVDADGRFERAGELFAVEVTQDDAEPVTAAVAETIATTLDEFGFVVTERDTSADAAPLFGPRSADESLGIAVRTVDLGSSPRVTDLYSCRGGVAETAFGACEELVAAAARALSVSTGSEAVARAEEIATLAGPQLWWFAAAPVRETSFIQRRITPPTSVSPVGGPLGNLAAFQVEG